MSIALLISMCTTTGTPLLEMRERSEIARPEITTKIFESGAWTVESDGRVETGCFDRKELRSIRRAIQHAPFKITSSPIACFAYDPNFTEYLVHGKLRFTERLCSGKRADNKTQEALALVKQDLADERQAAMTPLFEIHKKTQRSEAITTIYANGAWTFQPDSNGVLTKGQLDKATTASITHLVEDSPWNTIDMRFACRAYSTTSTEYYVHGQLEYTARLCGTQRLDDKSLGAIEKIESYLGPTSTTPSHGNATSPVAASRAVLPSIPSQRMLVESANRSGM
jgi:hypothetical protein